jgi:uncharacterized membrane protein
MPMQALSILALLLILAAMAASVAAKKLTVPGSLTGGLLAFLIYHGSGIYGPCHARNFFYSWVRGNIMAFEGEGGCGPG